MMGRGRRPEAAVQASLALLKMSHVSLSQDETFKKEKEGKTKSKSHRGPGRAAAEGKRKETAQIRGEQTSVVSAHDTALYICLF